VAKGSKYNTHALGAAGNFMDEILKQYKGSNMEMTKTIFETICILSHCDTANRSLLGVSGTCDEVCDVLPQLSYEEDSTIQLACRVIANLAANHPNNQHKLGASGACEFLLSVLNERCLGNKTDPAEAAVTTRAACWAMANLIESSKSANEDNCSR
jgi:hypothetical protein